MTRAERIIEARRMIEAGEFNRDVVTNEPDDLNSNKLWLSCGHWTIWFPKLRPNEPNRETCNECAREWIRRRKS